MIDGGAFNVNFLKDGWNLWEVIFLLLTSSDLRGQKCQFVEKYEIKSHTATKRYDNCYNFI